MKYSSMRSYKFLFPAIVILLISFFLPFTTEAQHLADSSKKINVISQKEFKRQMKKDDVVILDVRTPDEFSAGNIPGAVLIDYKDSSFAQQINKLDRNKHYLVYCKAGNRSNKAVQYMLENGFTNVQQLENGFSKWKNQAKEYSH
jgi:rhodanese-related sulfurtransferase